MLKSIFVKKQFRIDITCNNMQSSSGLNCAMSSDEATVYFSGN